MSPIKKPIASSQEYGRRPALKGGKHAPGYLGYLHGGGRSGTYRELVGRNTETSVMQRAIAAFKKHSEFKKPYLSDEFPEMEHYYSGPIQFPGTEYDPYTPDIGLTECWDVCKKNHSDVYFDDDCFVYVWMDHRLTLQGGKVIIDNAYAVEMVQIDDASIDGIIRKIFKSVSDIDANTNVIWTVTQPLFEACPGVDERIAKSCRRTYNEPETCAECPAAIVVAWDDAYSADTVARSATVNIGILYGVAPYDWVVAGVDFTVGSASTSGVTNTLSAGATACGTATITVTDACGDTATGYVRCTTGTWTEIESAVNKVVGEPACGADFYEPDLGSGTGTTTKIVGKYKVVEYVGGMTAQYPGSCSSTRYASGARYICISDTDVFFESTWSACENVGTESSPGTWPCCYHTLPYPDANRWSHVRGNTTRLKYEWTC